jgi:hypothetical protein
MGYITTSDVKSYNKSKGIEVIAICLECKNKTKHLVLTSIDVDGTAKDEDYEHDWYHWADIYQVIECKGCGSVSFRNEHSNSLDIGNEGEYPITVLVYPKRSIDTLNNKHFFNIPNNLRRIYRETIDCYNNENLTLCAAGLRALVEGLCKENKIENGEVEFTSDEGTKQTKRLNNLQGKINGLYEKGKLTKENANVLHEHRFLGNAAVHELTLPSKQELILAIEIIEHVLENIYEIPEKANQLRANKSKL